MKADFEDVLKNKVTTGAMADFERELAGDTSKLAQEIEVKSKENMELKK